MAKKPNPKVAPYQTYPGRTVESRVSNTNLLPGVHQTTRNTKYINALLGDLTSKGTLESFDGWVGSKSRRVSRKTDLYLSGRNRLDLGIESNSTIGDITDIAYEMAVTDAVAFKDAKQLISGKTYGYSPEIDVDKFVNFQNYHWMAYDVPEIQLDAGFNDDGTPAQIDINGIIGQPYYTTKTQANGQKLTLRNGMKLYFVQRGNGRWINSMDYMTVPSDSVNPKYYIVAGVGTGIQLLEYNLYANPMSPIAILAPVPWDKKNWDRTEWDTDQLIASGKQYTTIAIGSNNYNAWSRSNRWTHEQTVFEVARFLGVDPGIFIDNDSRAQRPIVEFDKNVNLWLHGHLGKAPVTVITNQISSLNAIQGSVRPVFDGYTLKNGDRVLSLGGNPSVRNKTFTVFDVNVGANFVPAADADPIESQSVLVLEGKQPGLTYYFDGTTWVSAQQMYDRAQKPLFRLFDKDGTPLENYTTSSFGGNEIFGYADGTNYDRELGMNIAFDSNYVGSLAANTGSISFKNFIGKHYKETSGIPGVIIDIPTDNYLRIWNDDLQQWGYSTGWKPVSQTFTVRSEYSITATAQMIHNGDMYITGAQWTFNPTYEWNISVDGSNFNLEEKIADQPARSWYGPLLLARYRDNIIHNYTGQRLQFANQRGNVFIDTTNTTVTLASSLFDNKVSYTSTDILPSDYVVLWRVGTTGPWMTANIFKRMKDDFRRPQIYVNGSIIQTEGWAINYTGGIGQPTTTPIGLVVHNISVGDQIDIIANGSMPNVPSAATNLSNLANNPYNDTFDTGSYGQLLLHFTSAIKKNALPLFVQDAYHQADQYPRFPRDGDNAIFGDNDWSFGSHKSQGVGEYILKHDHPADRYFWAMRSGEKGSIFALLEDARKAYGGFKLKLIQKIEQLNNDQLIENSSEVIDKALKEIFVGRDDKFRYAYSHMAMYGTPDLTATYNTNFTMGDMTFALPAGTELGEVQTDHVYVYVKSGADAFPVLQTYLLDYTIDQSASTVTIKNLDVQTSIELRVFKKNRTSFVPTTPAKLGITPWYYPRIVTDDTYLSGPVQFIQGHDGSLTPAWGDYRDDLLLEYERRVASSIGIERGTRAEFMSNKLWPKENRPSWFNRTEFNNYLEDHWLTWANENNVVLMPNAGHVNHEPFTYNFSAFTAVDGKTYGSWRDLYKHVFGTDRPHSHPWEMLGIAKKPVWWDAKYSWTDPTKRTALIAALNIGDRSVNKSYTNAIFRLLPAFNSLIPVDTNGNLLDPVAAGWYSESEVNANLASTSADWLFGQQGTYEIAWRRSSDFNFAAATWLLLSGGPSYLETVWEGPRNIPSPMDRQLNIDRDYGRITKWATAKQHRETSTDIVPGFGMLVNERAASSLGTNLVDVIAETRNIKTRLQWTAYGFLESNSLDFLADILAEQDKGTRLPKENYNINLKVTSPSMILVYSGVKVIQDASGGYRIDGYDNRTTYFSYYPVDTTKDSVKVSVGNINYQKYLYFQKNVAYLDYGTVLSTRQEVINFLIGYGHYLQSIGWLFEDTAPTGDQILDWGYSAQEFVTWSQTRWQPNTQIALSPASQDLVLSHATRFFGRLDTTFLSRTYLLDENSKRIEFKDTEVVRDSDRTTIKSRPGVGIYFVRCGLEEYTHVVNFDDTTTFNDIINDYLFGLRMIRLRAQGHRTKSWDGRPVGNGYIILNDGVLSNFDTISREIGDDYITIENRSANPWIANLKKAQQGQIVPDNVLLNTGFSKDTIDQFEAASMRRKGTPGLIDKYAKGLLGPTSNPNGLPLDAGISVKEDWMFRMGEDFGNTGSKVIWEIKLPPGSRDTLLDMFTVRSIPEFVQNSYYEANHDKAADNIVDLLGPNDRRWVFHPSAFSLPLRSASIQDGDLPQAGIPNRFETDYKFMDIDGLYNIDLTDDTMSILVAPTWWNPALNYNEGDQVRYSGILFQCKISHLASSVFVPENWTALDEPVLPSIWLANRTPGSNDIRDWTVMQMMDQQLGIMDICAGTEADPYHPLVEMLPGIKHNCIVGDYVFIASTEKSSALNGFYKVTTIRDTESFFIELPFNPLDFLAPEFPPGNTSKGGKLFVLRSAHFYTVDEMKNSLLDVRYRWMDGMTAYIDDRINDPEVFVFDGNYTLFQGKGLIRDNRALVFQDLTDNDILYEDQGSSEEDMPWLFSIGILLATFKAIAAGTLHLTDNCTVSLAALQVPEPKLPNFGSVQTITVSDAINGIIFRQFNDCAWILAEKIYGNITAAVAAVNTMFADNCLAKSAYVDPNTRAGYGTALDLNNISKYMWNTYPAQQSLFAAKSWFYLGRIYANNSDLIVKNDGIGIMAMQNTVLGNSEVPGVHTEYHQIGIKTYGSRQLMLTSIGYIEQPKRDRDALVLLNTVNSFGNTSGVFNPVPFYMDRKMTTIVDHTRITKVEVVDYENNKVLATLGPYDPAAGILPSYVDTYIDWKSSWDPATYTTADLTDQTGYTVRPKYAWFDDHVGEVWWDLSNVRYYDYYQGSTRERAFQWGKQFPGSSIDMYEWVKTSVPPAQWQQSALTGFLVDFENVSGTPYHVMDGQDVKYFWSERKEKDKTGVIRTFYYFWVKGMDRTLSSRRDIKEVDVKSSSGSVSTSYSLGTSGIGAAPTKINVTEIASTVSNPRVAGARWFAGLQSNAILLSGINDLLQTNGAVLRIEVDGTTDEHAQWLLLKEDDITSPVPDWLHLRLRDSMIGTDQTTMVYTYTTWEKKTSYLQGDVVFYPGTGYYYRAYRDFLPVDVTFTDGTGVHFGNQPWQRLWDYTLVNDNELTEVQGKSVPDYNRHPYDRYGNEIEPTQQSWLNDRIEAIRIFVDAANRQLASFPVTGVTGWDTRMTKIIHTADPSLVYDVSFYWDYVDFIDPSYDPARTPTVSFTSLSQLYLDTTVALGEYAAVYVGAQRLLNVWEKLPEGWKIVFQEKGTIQLSKNIFDLSKKQDLWDTTPWDSLRWDCYPFVALAEIITALREDIFVDNYRVCYNRVFFALSREVLRQNPACHWIRKSTYVDVVRISNGEYANDPYFRKEFLRNDDGVLLDYVNQIKPYHTKVLNQIEVDQKLELSSLTATDSHVFDVKIKHEDLGDPVWSQYIIDGHLFNQLQEGWGRNPWDYDFIAQGKLPATGEDVTRLKQYLWDMDQPRYDALVDTFINGYSFGVQPTALQAIIDGNTFYQPRYEQWPNNMLPLSPGESVEIRVINNTAGNTIDANTVAWRYHYDILGGVRVYRYNSEAQTTFISAVSLTDTELQVTDATALTRPDPVNGKPGVLWAARERIEFWEIDGNTLKQLVRGTLGTPVLTHPIGRAIYDGGQQNQLPTPEELTNWHDALYPMWNELGMTLADSNTREALFLKEKPGYFTTG